MPKNVPPLADSSLSLPYTFSGWLRYLWRDILFPGALLPEAGDWRLGSLVVLLLIPAVLLYPNLGFHLLEPDEGRYAEIPREMLERGDWVVPTLQGEPYLDKPPLLYWLIAACYRVWGIHEWTARLAPALALHATVLLTYFLGRRSLGERAAFRGALLLSLAPGFISMGRLLLLDGLLTLWTTLALFGAFEAVRGPRLHWAWWLLAGVACGLGILTKGPVILVLLLPPLLLQRWLMGTSCPIGWGAWSAFLLLAAGMAAPWFVAVCVAIPEFVRYFFWEHHVLRYMTSFAHERGFWFYVPILLLGLLPASALAWPLLRFLGSAEEMTRRQRPVELGFPLLAGVWCVLFFSLSSCKLPTYILPAFPPLALVLGYFLAHSRWQYSPWPARTAVLAFALLVCCHHLILPWYAGYRSPMGRPEEVRRWCSDPAMPVVCFPRGCDSVAFYLGRSDLKAVRSRDIDVIRDLVWHHPRVVVLCAHRSTLEGLKQLLPPEFHVAHSVRLELSDIPGVPQAWTKTVVNLLGRTSLGLADVAVVERRPPEAE